MTPILTEEILAMCASHDEWQAFMDLIPCKELKCRLQFTRVWDIEGVWMTHNGMVKIFSDDMLLQYNVGWAMRDQIVTYLSNIHSDSDPLGLGIVPVMGLCD